MATRVKYHCSFWLATTFASRRCTNSGPSPTGIFLVTFIIRRLFTFTWPFSTSIIARSRMWFRPSPNHLSNAACTHTHRRMKQICSMHSRYLRATYPCHPKRFCNSHRRTLVHLWWTCPRPPRWRRTHNHRVECVCENIMECSLCMSVHFAYTTYASYRDFGTIFTYQCFLSLYPK